MTLQADEVQITANDRYSGNNRYSGIKRPDRFFHYSGRCLYKYISSLLKKESIGKRFSKYQFEGTKFGRLDTKKG